MDAPHIKRSCGTQNEISNPLDIGLPIDYVTFRNIRKCIPPKSNIRAGQKKPKFKSPILWL